MNRSLRTLLSLAMLISVGVATAAEEASKMSYVPVFHGAIRARYEMDTETGASRFQVRNARLSLTGKIFPSVDYFAQTDLCDRGSMKILDAWARVGIVNGLSVQAGQFRMPFGIDPFRAPNNYIFANRSFMARQVCNYRAVGVKGSYAIPKTGLLAEIGMFNPTTIGNHEVWTKKYAYAGKLSYTLGDFKFTTGLMSIIPDGVRANLIDACIGWTHDRWTVEGEYMNEHYTNDAHKACHAYNFFVDYRMPIRAGVFNALSFQGRFDGMTDQSNGYRNADGLLETNYPSRNRLTLGATISAVRLKNIYVDLRANYEQYFYHHGVEATEGNGNKALMELVVRF